MTPQALIAELERRRLRVVLRQDGAGVKLRAAMTPDLVTEARRHKETLRTVATANEAIALLNRLKTFTLPNGRMPVARILATRLSSISNMGDDGTDPTEALEALRNLEIDLLGIGASPDVELVVALAAFPDSRIQEIKLMSKDGQICPQCAPGRFIPIPPVVANGSLWGCCMFHGLRWRLIATDEPTPAGGDDGAYFMNRFAETTKGTTRSR